MNGVASFLSVTALAVALAMSMAAGCSTSSGTAGGPVSRLIGRALAPEPDSDETSPLANQVVVLLTYDDQGNIVSAEVGTTDANGQFIVDAEAQAVVAVVVGSLNDEANTEISGLFNPDEPVIEKDLDEATSIACAAGLTAIGDGSITEEQLNAERVQNLEAASVEYILANPDFDYYSETDRTSAVEAVRVATDDGAHPAASDAFTA
ncbi:MAG: hypothetical protein DRH23_13440 [Deltaproteobacteria bacterium]|nr:MAG: hypothetical protein DRH23_13440 [Deltaproteobacteria bacterium]